MKKLNLDELEQKLDIIEIDQLYCVKASDGGYGDGGDSPAHDYSMLTLG